MKVIILLIHFSHIYPCVSSHRNSLTSLSFLRKQQSSCFYLWVLTYPLFSLCLISICTFLFLERFVPGGLHRGITGQSCLCVWVCVNEIKWEWMCCSGNCLWLSGYISSALICWLLSSQCILWNSHCCNTVKLYNIRLKKCWVEVDNMCTGFTMGVNIDHKINS